MAILYSGVAASVIALVFRIKLLTTHDSTWHQAELALCTYVQLIFQYLQIKRAKLSFSTSIAENNTAILVGCMPAFAKFVKFVGSSIANRRSQSNQNLFHQSDESFKHEAWQIQVPPSLPHSYGRAGSSGRNDSLEYCESTDIILSQTQAGYGQQTMQFPRQDLETGISKTTDTYQQEVWTASHVQSVEHAFRYEQCPGNRASKTFFVRQDR